MIEEFFESNASFAITINLLKTTNQKYVVFKPTISIASIDKETLVNFINKFAVGENIAKAKRTKSMANDLYIIKIQNFVDITKLLLRLKNHKFVSKRRELTIQQFNDVFADLNSIGHVHKKWDNIFENIIDIKLKLNEKTRTRKGFTKEEWISKIKSHLQES